MLAYAAKMEAVTVTATVIAATRMRIRTLLATSIVDVAGHPVLSLCMDIEERRHDGAMDGMGRLVTRPSLALGSPLIS